jgi:sugar lactone lactonase YvrE
MAFPREEDEVRVCPKTGKIIRIRGRFGWVKWLFPLTGLAALIWFLIRVIPKPSRATYPCQRVAFPIASGFIIWIMGAAASVVAARKARKCFVRASYVAGAILIIASVGFIWTALSSTRQQPTSAHEPIVANEPMGEGIGVKPGRVTWIHNPDATSWTGDDGNNNPPYWHSNESTNQQVVNDMLSKGLRALTGRSTDYAAWDAIFRDFNRRKGRGNVGYTPGEKIAMKLNFTLMTGDPAGGVKLTSRLSWIDNSPQLAIALLKQLTDVVGAAPGDISLGDPGRMMPNYWYDIVGPNCPGVVYLTKSGLPLYGRTEAVLDYNAPFYWSDPCAAHFNGVTNQDYIPMHFAQATYFINFPILKSHNGSGITVCGKNYYGSLRRNPADSGYYSMHLTRVDADGVAGMGHYRAIVDLISHPRLGGKTVLALVDFLYAGRSWDSRTIRWDMAPFNHDWPNSILLSQDQVAADSVAFDFMDTEWDAPYDPADYNSYPQMSGADDYLHEAAMVPDPQSGADYDPNHDGSLTKSLGVHEHWNNATQKKYTRNLGTGEGIELVTAAPGNADLNFDNDVNFVDFAVLAKAWKTTAGQANWNPVCDISAPADGVIDMMDVTVLADNWLEEIVLEPVVPGATIQQVYYAGGIGFEGPTYDKAGQKLYFSKRTAPMQTLRLDSPGSATIWNSDSNNGNGTILSLEGRLLVAEEDPPKIVSYRIGPNGPQDANTRAIPLAPPNDLTQLANGMIFFTCPIWSGPTTNQGIYRLDPNGTVTRVNSALAQPNGLEASNDGTKLYVAESSSSVQANKRWWVFPINANGSLGTGSVFFRPTSPPNWNDPDGMTIDEYGNLYFCGMGGVWIISPQGVQLDMIPVPEFITNVCFGGPENKTLYITGDTKVYSLAMQVRGGGHGGELAPQIPETATPPTIDGTIDSIWSTAAARPTSNVILGSVSNDADLSSQWQAMWDANNLYILVDVNDDAHYNDSAYDTPWEDDAVELYIDADSSMGSAYDSHDYELVFRWNDPDIHTGMYSAKNITGMTFAIVNRTGGHIFEAKLPWASMGVAPGTGSQFGLDVHLCDDDDGGSREAKEAWQATNDNSWQWPYMFATVQLAGFTAAAPEQARDPNPGNGATGVGTMTMLSWVAGSGALTHDVYFGTATPPPFIGNQTETTYNPGTLNGSTTYHWQIDEKNGIGTTTGTLWSFTTGAATPPGQASSPSPSNVATGINTVVTLSWTAGAGATSHDVYFGTSATPPFIGNQAGTTYNPGTLANNTTYNWRIDEKNSGGTTTGVAWSFTTGAEVPGPWVCQDLDSPGAAGSAIYSGGTFTVNGSGADIAGTSDAGYFIYQSASGDCNITARVVSFTGIVADWAKAGVMIRQSLDPNSKFSYGDFTRNVSGGVQTFTHLRRITTGGGAAQNAGGGGAPPYWVRVVRTGNYFRVYVSSTGSSWTSIDGDIPITMSGTVYIGLAVTSHQAGALSTAVFDNVTVVP